MIHKGLKWIRYFFEEVKFIRNPGDIKIFLKYKLPFVLPNLTGKIRDHKLPQVLQIEPTNNCNLDCVCCSRRTMKRNEGYMDFKLFQKIIDEASELKVKRVHLYLHGEPFLHPQIVEMIHYIKKYHIGFNITTNGMPLNDKKIEDILKSGTNSADYIKFSLLGYSEETHKKIQRGVDHDRVLNNIFKFLELRKKFKVNGPIIGIDFYRLPENEREEDEFTKYWKRIVDHVNIFNISQQFAGCNSLPTRTKTCRYLWERMTIYWNGDVTLCNADLHGDYLLGSLEDNSIREIWNSDVLSSVKQKHRDNKFEDLELCRTCDR